MPKAGQRLLKGLREAGEEFTTRRPGSAKKGIWVESDVFEEVTRLAGNPKSAENAADREALLKAFQTVTGIVQVAQIEAVTNPAEDEVDTLETAVDRVLERSESVSPRERSALIATISNQIDKAATRVTGEQGERIDSLKQKLQTEFQKTPNDPSSGLTPGKAVQAFDEHFQNIQARRTLQLPGGPAADTSRRNPEVSTARLVEVQQSPPAPPRPGTRPDDRSGSAPATPTFDSESSPEILDGSPPRRASPQATPRPQQEEESSDEDLQASFQSTEQGDLSRTVSTAEQVQTSVNANPGVFASVGTALSNIREFAANINPYLQTEIDTGTQAANEIQRDVLEGQIYRDDDVEYANDMVSATIERADDWLQGGEPEIAATILVAGKARIDERLNAHNESTTGSAEERQEISDELVQSGEAIVSFLAENVDNDSIVRHGFATDFQIPVSSSAPQLGTTETDAPSRSASLPSGRAPPASPVDGASHPHVATAVFQHVSTTGRRIPPPLRPDRTISVPDPGRLAAEAVAVEAARNQKYSAQEKKNLRGMASTSRKTGTLEIGPPPRANPTNIRILAENLEENPRVAALVQRGLLTTRDLMNPVYVRDMEKTLAKRELTKEIEGRDPRYRPRTARQAYRPPVNVTTTESPGIYRYQRPRFARPEIPQPTES